MSFTVISAGEAVSSQPIYRRAQRAEHTKEAPQIRCSVKDLVAREEAGPLRTDLRFRERLYGIRFLQSNAGAKMALFWRFDGYK